MAANGTAGNGTINPHTRPDQRRDKRFEITQAAVFTQPGHPDVACEIRDFCLGGMFLKFAQADAAIASLTKRTDSEVEIVFTSGASDAPKTNRIPARIRRMTQVGVGVAFLHQPTEALRALQRLRMADQRRKLASLPAGGSDPKLREASTTLLAETLDQVHEQLARTLGDRLNASALHAAGISEHGSLLAAVAEFRVHGARLGQRFISEVLGALTGSHQVSTAATRKDQVSELALVDEDDFEDWLATSSEATKLEETFQEELADIEPRIGQLFNFACDRSNNPFGPAVISHAYRNAIAEITVSARARQVAYATLREILGEELAPLYAELLALLPVSEAEVEPVASQPQPLATHDVPQPKGATSQDAPAAAAGPAASTSAAPAKGTLSRLAGSLMDFFRGPAGRAAAPAPAAPPPAQGTPAGASAAAPATRLMPGVAHSPVLQRLAATGGLPQTRTPELQRSVDMFGALFDTMHAEKSINENTRPFFQQLESSLINLAMSDSQFLSTPAHPAHKVLNTLDRLSMVAGDDGKITDERLLRLMRRWTDRIRAEADKNPGVFEEARTQLERVVKPLLNERAARVFRLQEMCEGRQSAEVARHRILRTLLEKVGDRSVPNAVIELLNGGWRNVLLRAEMRHGPDSDEARDAWDVLQRLCAWLDPDAGEPPTTADVQTLLQRIDEALTQVCSDKFAQDRIVDQLAAALFDEDRGKHQRTSVTARLADAAGETPSEAHEMLAERLRVGDWLQFKKLDAPLNLVWIGDHPPVYVFANYRGVKKLDLKRQDLLDALEKHDAQWTEDLELPLMDRSYSAMIQKMQRDLLWQASHDPATGLANRRAFFRAIRRNWLRSRRTEGGYAIGVVQFEITTPLGEPAGAEVRTAVLRGFAQQLPAHLPPNAQLARAGESALAFWIEATDIAAAQAQAHTLLEVIDGQPQVVDGVRHRVEAVAGLMWSADCLHPEAYYDNANAACTRTREAGLAVMSYNSERDDSGMQVLAQWAHDLTTILAENQLSLNCQPVAAAGDDGRTPLYYEILLHPTTQTEGGTATRELIDVAERLQRITEIDRWVVKTVLHWMRAHPDALAGLGGLSINLSGQSVTNPLFLRFLLAELGRGDIAGEKLIFEISEADAVEGHAQTQLFMRQLQRHGCRFTLDEFGVASSSYTQLKSLKLDYLKIDRALVREISTSVIDEALVRSILETGSFLGIKTVAGFVEDAEAHAKLTEMGVDCVQGYWVGEPRPLEQLA